MGEIFAHYASEIWSFVAGLAGGGTVGSLLTIRYMRKQVKASGGATVTDQSGARAGGDMVGRDKISGSKSATLI